MGYAERGKYGLTRYSIDWIDRARKVIWESTRGTICNESIDELRLHVLSKYRSEASHSKALGFGFPLLVKADAPFTRAQVLPS